IWVGLQAVSDEELSGCRGGRSARRPLAGASGWSRQELGSSAGSRYGVVSVSGHGGRPGPWWVSGLSAYVCSLPAVVAHDGRGKAGSEPGSGPRRTAASGSVSFSVAGVECFSASGIAPHSVAIAGAGVVSGAGSGAVKRARTGAYTFGVDTV